jgi:DNA invertase Pin-like site-specific DNA recombinase
MPSMVRAAIYCRLSKKGGRSLERQEQDGREIAAARGWHVVRVFAETASASELARKPREQWELLLAAVRASDFDAVIVWLEDRSNRDVVKAAEFVQACRAAGVRLVIADSEVSYDFTDPEDTARFYGEVVAAQREIGRLSKRVRRARLQEAAEGRRHPGGPRAFGDLGIGPKGNGRTPATRARVEFEQERIREAAARILAGDSLRGIVLDWGGRRGEPPRVPSSNGGRWTTQTLRRLLLAPRVAGLREHRPIGPGGKPAATGTLYPSAEIEPILDRETWEAVRAVLTDPARKTQAVGGTARHLLTGMCYCGRCGARLRCVRDREVWVYRCMAGEDGGRRCVSRHAGQVEALIVGALFAAVEGDEWDQQAAERPAADPARPHHERLAALTAELDVLDRRIGEAELATELGRRPHPSAATLRRMLAEREAEAERHRAAVLRLQRGRTVAAIPRNLRQVWPSLSLDRQRAILKAVLRLPPEGKGIVIHPQGRGKPFDPEQVVPDWRI